LYLIESFIVELLLIGINLIFPLAEYMALLAIFGVVVIILLSILLKLWQKGNFAGSVEWMIQKATKF